MMLKTSRGLARIGGLAAAVLAAASAHAGLLADGLIYQITPAPGSSGAVPSGPGNLSLPSSALYVGFDGRVGSLTLDTGSVATFRSLTLAGVGSLTSGPLTGDSVLRLQGANTRLNVQGVSTGWGPTDIFVSSGAVLDARTSGCADKSFNFFFCSTTIGSLAGPGSALEISGTGSSFLGRSVTIATGNASPLVNGTGGGTVGGQAGASIDLLNGATGRSWNLTVGGQASGTQTSLGQFLIQGPGSVWTLDGYQSATEGTAPSGLTTAAYLIAGNGPNATGRVDVRQGGRLQVDGAANVPASFIILGNMGGTGEMTVSGAGSTVAMAAGKVGSVTVGRGSGSQGTLTVENGGTVQGLQFLGIGRAVWNAVTSVFSGGGTGTVVVDGTGSKVTIDQATAAVGTPPTRANVGVLAIAQGGSTQGTLTVRNGGQVEVLGTVASTTGPALFVGRDAGDAGAPNGFTGRGTLNIQGPGSTVTVRSDAVAGAANPLVRIGRTGTGVGELNISGGGQLVVEGNAASTLAAIRQTSVIIGGNANGLANGVALTGGVGRADVDGAGSALRVQGNDRFLGVGIGNGADGSLTVRNGGLVTASQLDVARVGTTGSAVGALTVNNGRVELSGPINSAALGVATGPSLNIGRDTGATGTAVITNGSVVTVDGTSAAPATIRIGGGSTAAQGGVGTVTVSGGSTLQATGAGSQLLVGQGGTGTLIVNNSTVSAENIRIGTGGYLGGNGTVLGTVTNEGVINPGNSPGTLVFNGPFINAGGRIVLEVQADGSGGFVTDRLLFTDPSLVNLGGTAISFSFLEGTNPLDFAQSGLFKLDTFFARVVEGGTQALAAEVFGALGPFTATAASYAISSFGFSAAGGVDASSLSVTAVTAVPEPGTYALMLAGLGVVGFMARRRSDGKP